MTEANYLRLRFTLTSGSGERLAAELWSLGTLGIESTSTPDGDPHQFLAYFEEPLCGELRERLEASGDWPNSRFEEMEPLAAEDWLAEYRRHIKPIEIGAGFLVDSGEPGEAMPVQDTDRVLLRIPARAAFGTGSHESTQLAIELMEKIPMAGRRVLDVGTGTGILAFAAMALGSREVVGLDIDPTAVLLAAGNCRLNRRYPSLVAGTVHCLKPLPLFDVALVNVLPGSIRHHMASIAELVAQGGRLVVSGLLVEQQARYRRQLARLGLGERCSRRAGDWLACVVEKAG